MKKKLQTFLLVGLFAIGNAFAQNKIITGKVTGADDGLPLPGVSVIMKGTNKGTQTDADGKYTISVPPEAVLIFSYLGYIRQEVPTENLTTISISLRPETTELAEVKIVVPYGTATKKTYTGSAAVISGPDMAKRQVSDFTKALEGVAPGIQVTSSSGQPGTGAGIRIRGFNSINANMDPLYVVDGVPYNGDISAINTTDIESITALKDAASASLYGARAANGVILITTKKGKEGEPNLDVSARFGVNSIGVRQYDILTSPKDYYETAWKAIKQEALFRPNNPLSETDAAAYASENLIPKLGYNNYNVLNNQLIDPTTGKLNPAAQLLYHDDWGKESFKPQLRQEYNTSLSGLKDKTNYYMSFGYLKDKGYVVKSDFERFTTRLKLHQKVNNWLNTDLNLSYSNSKSNLSQTDNDAYQNFFSFARNVAPIYPVYLRDANDNYVYDKNGKRKYDFGAGEMGIRTYAGTENPLATLALDQDELKSGSFSGKTFAEINFLNDFKFTTNFSYDATNNNRVSWQNNQYGNAANVNGRGSVISSINSTLNFNQLLNYTKTINSDHKIGVLLGHENYNYNSGYLGGGKENFLLLNNSQLDNAVVIQSLSSYTDRYAVEGYFGNINYSYKSKYTASGSIRRDASSRFAPEHRWGTFWSTSAGYVLSEESFIKDLTFIDLLKLRASYGTRGNDDLGNSRNYYYAYQDQYSVTNNNGNTAIALVYKGNRDITWETRKDFNIGLDFGLFKSRLNGTIEYYHSKTQDLLFDLPLPLSTGITSQPYNIGDLKNTGIELGLNGDVIKTEDFKWNISLNASRPKNTITKLPEQFRQNGLKTGNFNYMEGHSIYDYFTYKYAGVDPNSGEALYFKDVTDANGIVTGKTTVKKTADATRYYTGDSAIPKFFGGIGTSITYRDFDFSIQTSYRIGGKVMDYSYRALMSGGGGDWVNWHKDILKSWTPENKNSNIPIIKENYTYGNETSDRFLIDASYFSIQNITLGYKLPAAFVKKYKLGTIRIYAVADNVYLWAKRKGLDPRQAFNGTIESGSYSPMRTVSMGLNINF